MFENVPVVVIPCCSFGSPIPVSWQCKGQPWSGNNSFNSSSRAPQTLAQTRYCMLLLQRCENKPHKNDHRFARLSKSLCLEVCCVLTCRTLPVVMSQMMTQRAGVKGEWLSVWCGNHLHWYIIWDYALASHLVKIYPGVLCVGLVQTLTRALVQGVARLTLQQRRKRTVTSQCQTMSPVTKSRAENLQTSTLFTLILIYLCHFMQDIFHKSPPLFSLFFFFCQH